MANYDDLIRPTSAHLYVETDLYEQPLDTNREKSVPNADTGRTFPFIVKFVVVIIVLNVLVILAIIFTTYIVTKKEYECKITPSVTLGINDSVCHKLWIQHDGHCYLFQDKARDWIAAQTDCEIMNSNLVKIEDSQENMWLKERLTEYNVSSMWIGAHDRNVEGRYRWIKDNSPLVFTDWDVGQPDNYKNNEDCIEIRVLNQWNDLSCWDERPYICEKII